MHSDAQRSMHRGATPERKLLFTAFGTQPVECSALDLPGEQRRQQWASQPRLGGRPRPCVQPAPQHGVMAMRPHG
jgi:hypothetical protein